MLTDEQSQDLHCDLIKLDFTETVEQLNMYKTPGLDGTPDEFYYLFQPWFVGSPTLLKHLSTSPPVLDPSHTLPGLQTVSMKF